MRTGEVYIWKTKKAKGYDERDKFHIFICNDDWQDGITFLFICSAHYFGDFTVTQADCPFLKKEESSISCGRPVFYSPPELEEYEPQLVGRLSSDCMKRLFNHIAQSETMEARHIKRVCAALAAAVS
jgi:hypothetical protein